jgi:hypothetical protein
MRRIPEGQVTNELQCPSEASMFRLAATSEESGRVRSEQVDRRKVERGRLQEQHRICAEDHLIDSV